MGQRRRFTPVCKLQVCKLQAVRLLEAGQRPAAEIARELGIPRNRLYKWQQQVRRDGAGVFPGSGRQAQPAAEMARLTRELARVTEERDMLKKAPVSSTSERNTCREYGRWRLRSQRLPRTLIQAQRGRVQVDL